MQIIDEYLKMLLLDNDTVITLLEIESHYKKLVKIYHPKYSIKPFQNGIKYLEITTARNYLISNIDEVNRYILSKSNSKISIDEEKVENADIDNVNKDKNKVTIEKYKKILSDFFGKTWVLTSLWVISLVLLIVIGINSLNEGLVAIFLAFLLLVLVASILLIKDIIKKQYINKALKLIARIKKNYNESKEKAKITEKAQNIKTKCVLYKQKLQEFPLKFQRFVFNFFENTVVLIAFWSVSLILFLTVGVSFLNKGMVGIFVAFLVLFLTISVLLIRNVSKKQYKYNVSNLIAEIDKINNLEKIGSRDNSKLSIVKCKLLEKLKTNIFKEALPIGYIVLSLFFGIIFIALAVEIPVSYVDYLSPSFNNCSGESVAVFTMFSGIFILCSLLVKRRKIAKNLFIFSVICMYLPLICFITPFQSAYSYNSNIYYVLITFVLFVLSHFLVFYKLVKNVGYERLTLSEGEYYFSVIKELKNKLYITMEEYYELDDEISKLII